MEVNHPFCRDQAFSNMGKEIPGDPRKQCQWVLKLPGEKRNQLLPSGGLGVNILPPPP